MKDNNHYKWTKVAQRISKQSPLTDLSENLIKASQEFRVNFELKSPVKDRKLDSRINIK